MSQYSHSHPFLPRTTSITDYMTMTKKSKPRKPRFNEDQRSKSSSPQKSFAQPQVYSEPNQLSSQIQAPTIPQINAFITTPSQVETPVIIQGTPQNSFSQPPLYLIHPDAEAPIELPPWVAEFRPRIPPLNGFSYGEDPIPQCESITHAILIRDALTKFHLAVYLADEDAGESEDRFRQNLTQICSQYMPAMTSLGIKKHQIVFFYHGRKQIRMGNLVWDAISEQEMERKRKVYEVKQRSEQRYDVLVADKWSRDVRSGHGLRHAGHDIRW